MSPDTVVFVGPSLSAADQLVDDRHLRPPAERGHITREVERGARRILLIDGLMIQRYGPSPTEIYDAISAGALVVGAASLGALRAVELRDFGMIGIGWVYHAYLTGLTDADDEVLAVCDPETWRPLSVPAIRVRYALQHLVAAGHVDAEQADRCMVELRRRSVEERNPATVADCAALAGISPGQHGRLLDSRFRTARVRAAAVEQLGWDTVLATAGYGVGGDPVLAATRALLELAQSRATDRQGAREDCGVGEKARQVAVYARRPAASPAGEPA